MATVQKSLRIPDDVIKAIEDLAEADGLDFSALAIDLLSEALKMRRCPGILFADGPTGRRARLAGTGLEVWEVIATYLSVERDPVRLRQTYPWLSEAHLRAALGYYAAYPHEIERRITANERWTQERLLAQHPSLAANRQ